MKKLKTCRNCGLPLSFKRLKSGKLCPTNLDGSDHWDLCRETQNAALTPQDRGRRDKARSRPVVTGTITHAYCGSVPPWDDSLGPFRDFTAEEKRDSSITRAM